MLGATHRTGIIGGYWISALVRSATTVAVVTVVALIAGLQVVGGGIDLIGLYTLALFTNAFAMLFGTGVAMRLRTMQAGPLIQTPAFLLLFLAPVWVPYDLLTGWVQTAASVNPITLVSETVRGWMIGDPTKVLPAFLVVLLLVSVSLLWSY